MRYYWAGVNALKKYREAILKYDLPLSDNDLIRIGREVFFVIEKKTLPEDLPLEQMSERYHFLWWSGLDYMNAHDRAKMRGDNNESFRMLAGELMSDMINSRQWRKSIYGEADPVSAAFKLKRRVEA